MTGFPYSFAHADLLAAGLVRIVLPRAPQKGLITDLDETLWGSVLGDDGPEGISWDVDHKTQFHALYQNLLNLLAEGGSAARGRFEERRRTSGKSIGAA